MYFHFNQLLDSRGLSLYLRDDMFNHFLFHPEAAVVNHLQRADNAADSVDCESDLLIFVALIDSLCF